MSVSVNSTNKHKGDVMERRVIHRETKVATLDQMRAAAEALKGVDRACDITQAKPEFVEFIRKCSPASVLAVLNQHATLTEQRDRLATALRSLLRDYEQTYRDLTDGQFEFSGTAIRQAQRALATVEQEGGESDSR